MTREGTHKNNTKSKNLGKFTIFAVTLSYAEY